MSFGPDVVAALSNVGDAGVTVCIDEVVVVEGGRVVAAVSRVVVVVDVDELRPGLCWFGSHGNGEQVAPLFSFGCTNMTKWSMHSPKVYKPSLLLVIPRACLHINYIS